MTTDELKLNIENVTQRISRAAQTSSRTVTLIAAAKTVPAETVNAALECGISEIGENRVQEYLQKRDAVKPLKWHFIGTLQRNKVKYLVGEVALIQSVNCEQLASEIHKTAIKRGVVQNVLIEVNAAGEASKTGVPFDRVDELIAFARELSGIAVKGIMSVPPVNADNGVYERLFKLYDKYRDNVFDTLSVGMSGDYERAIANGSNMVRIGTAIFGKRRSTDQGV